MTKKVVYFIPEFPRLTETFIEREVAKLIERGNVDLTVVAVKKATGSTSPEVLAHTVYARPNLLDLVQGLFRYAARSPQAFKLISGNDMASIVNRYLLFIKSFGYANIFSKYNPAHLHAHFLSWPSTVGMVAATLMNIPYSISGHARDVMVDGTLIAAKVRTAKFIAICNKYAYQSCKDQAKGENCANVYQQYHGVDVAKLNLEKIQAAAPSRPFIFIGSRLVEKKGLDYAIQASRLLKDKGIAHEMHIVGPGPLYEKLLQQIAALGVTDTVMIHGEGKGLPWQEILPFYKQAAVFAHPSIDTSTGDADGVPTFIIEAALCKLPIVTTDAGSIADLIINNETGLVVEQRNAQDLADALAKIINNPKLGKSLGENAYNKASEMFSLDKNIAELEQLLLS